MFSPLLKAASLMDFETDFAVEALMAILSVRDTRPAYHSKTTDTFSLGLNG